MWFLLALACSSPSSSGEGGGDGRSGEGGAGEDTGADDTGALPPPPPGGLVHWWSGDEADAIAPVDGPAALLVGGGLEPDDAVAAWLARAPGGDIVVLRTSGEDGYNPYLYGDIGGADSVLTLRLDTRDLADDPWVAAQLAGAEAVFLAGGDQWSYLETWAGTATGDALAALWSRGALIGGTSAGLAVLGDPAFTAENGTVYSGEALTDPYDPYVTLGPGLGGLPVLDRVVTDSHFTERDRLGRLVAFVGRAWTDDGEPAVGLGIDEETAALVDGAGEATVFGDGHAWVVTAAQPPGQCATGTPLTWNAVRVAAVPAGRTFAVPGGETDVPATTVAAAAGALSD